MDKALLKVFPFEVASLGEGKCQTEGSLLPFRIEVKLSIVPGWGLLATEKVSCGEVFELGLHGALPQWLIWLA
jgi:hypothetical protein